MSLWAQWSLGELNFSGFWMWVFPRIGDFTPKWMVYNGNWDDFGLKTHYFRKHPCFWVFLLSIQPMPAKIHWSVGNALAHFSGRDSPQNPSCSGEINWAFGLQNLCNNSNKHLGGETSKSFFFGIWNSPLEKKKLWGRFIIYISNEFEVAFFFFMMGWFEKKPPPTKTADAGIKSSWRTSVSCSVSSWRPGVSWTPPMHWSGRGRPETVELLAGVVGGASGFVTRKPRGVGQDWLGKWCFVIFPVGTFKKMDIL